MPDARISELPAAVAPSDSDLTPLVQTSGSAALETRRATVAQLRSAVLVDRGAHVRDYGAVGDGVADDAPAIQAAITDLKAKGGGTLQFGARVYRIASAVAIADAAIRLQGMGYTEGKGGGQGTWLKIDAQGFVPFTFSGLATRGSGVRDLGVQQAQPAIAPGWSPAPYNPVFKVLDCLGGLEFDNIFLAGVSTGIYANNSGRLDVRRLRGQVLIRGIEIDSSPDLPRLTGVHFWPIWSADAAVLAWQQANADAVLLRRCDGAFLDQTFVQGYRSALRLGASVTSTGTATKVQIGQLQAANTQYGLLVEADGVTGQIANLAHQAEAYGGSGQPMPGGSGLRISGSNNRLQIGNLRIDAVEDSAIAITGTGNRLDLFSLRCARYNTRNTGAAALAIADSGSAAPNEVYLGAPPLLETGNGGPLVTPGTNAVLATGAPGGSAAKPGLQVGASDTGVFSPGAGTLALAVAGTEALRASASGVSIAKTLRIGTNQGNIDATGLQIGGADPTDPFCSMFKKDGHANWTILQSGINENPIELSLYGAQAQGRCSWAAGASAVTVLNGTTPRADWIGRLFYCANTYFLVSGVAGQVVTLAAATLTATPLALVDGPAPGAALASAGNSDFYVIDTSFVGTCDVAGAAVTWRSGQKFAFVQQITIGGTTYRVAAVNSPTSLTLVSSAGNQINASFLGRGNINHQISTFRLQAKLGAYESNLTFAAQATGAYTIGSFGAQDGAGATQASCYPVNISVGYTGPYQPQYLFEAHPGSGDCNSFDGRVSLGGLGGSEALRAIRNPSGALNRVEVVGGAAGSGNATIRARGKDPAVALAFDAQGAAGHDFTNGSYSAYQLRVAGPANATAYAAIDSGVGFAGLTARPQGAGNTNATLYLGRSGGGIVSLAYDPVPSSNGRELATTGWVAAQGYLSAVPVAGPATLGGIKPGSGVSVAADGTLNVTASGSGGGSSISGLPTQGSASANDRVGMSIGGADATMTFASFASLIGSYLSAPILAAPPATRIYQRDTTTGGPAGSTANRGAGAVAVTMNLSLPVTSLEYRSVDAGTGTALMNWTSAGSNLAAGTQALTLSLPAGTAWQKIQLRANGFDASIVTGASAIAVGDVTALAGQSLAALALSDAGLTNWGGANVLPAGLTPHAATAMYGNVAATAGSGLLNPTVAWGNLVSGGFYGSAFAVEYLNRMVAAAGVAQALIGLGVGATAIAQWANGQSLNTTFKSYVANGAGNKIGALIWIQGHDDSSAGNFVSQASYQNALTTLLADFTTTFNGRSFVRAIMAIPSIGSGSANATYTIPANIQAIRAAHLAYAAANPATTVHVTALDLALTDGVHPSQASGAVTLARHFYRAVGKQLGLLAKPALGPAMTGAQQRASGASASLVVNVSQQAGATGWQSSGTAASQFRVFNAGGTATEYVVTACDLTQPGRILLTIANPPGDAQALDIHYRYPLDSATALAGAIYDNNLDGDGLATGRPLQMLSAPVTAAAALAAGPASGGSLSGSAATQGVGASFSFGLTGGTSGFVALRTGGVDEAGSGVSGTSGSLVLTPLAAGTYTARLYSASGGALLAETPSFVVAAAGTSGGVFATTAGLRAWYRPSLASSVASSGGSVSQVNDLSGNGFHATRASGAQPTLVAGTPNGQQVLAFNGASQALTINGLATDLSGTAIAAHWFMVARLTAAVPSGGWVAPVSLGQSDVTPRIGFYASTSQHFNFVAGNAYTSVANTPVTNQWYLVEGTFDPASGAVTTYVNQTLAGTVVNQPAAVGNNALSVGRIGCAWNAAAESRYFGGQLAELAVVKGRIVSGSERSAILQGLNAAYGLGLSIV